MPRIHLSKKNLEGFGLSKAVTWRSRLPNDGKHIMRRKDASTLLHYLSKLTPESKVGMTGDAELLDRFVRQRDHEAFVLILKRHGPMVWGVCCRDSAIWNAK